MKVIIIDAAKYNKKSRDDITPAFCMNVERI